MYRFLLPTGIMCQQNAERIKYMERKISRLEKRLAEIEKSRSSKSGQ